MAEAFSRSRAEARWGRRDGKQSHRLKAGARKSPLKRAELCPYARRRAISAGNAHLGMKVGSARRGMPGCGMKAGSGVKMRSDWKERLNSSGEKRHRSCRARIFPAVVSSARRVAYSALFCTLQRALPCPRLQAVGKGFRFSPFSSARFSAASRKGFSHPSRLSFLVAESRRARLRRAHLGSATRPPGRTK
jgi:hypothetical protein